MKERPIVIAFGGNAIHPKDGAGTAEDQFDRTRRSMRPVAEMIVEHRPLVVTHGNGPIVGNIFDRNRAAAPLIPPMPLDVCGADSQGGIGYMIQQAIQNDLTLLGASRPVATVVTQVVVDGEDPAFRNPTKPIGRYLSSEEAERFRSHGWTIVEDSGRGLRRVVPSPRPLEIVEWETIRDLLFTDHVVVAVGGGGVPVVRRPDGTLQGVEAVVDKDAASALLARQIGASGLVFLTSVEKVALRYGKPDQKDLDELDVAEAKRHLAAGEFPPGSMGPKIRGAVEFLESGGEWAVVTSPDLVAEGIAGTRGTRIVPSLARKGGAS